ncbi:MAG: hypothetical protein A2790_06045 [Phenylobacterium sp. RIFCSPHIGHO2_01_FULL_69_31]|uniref:hypothetical protein n=1 Tax=Phenylobacterium sp. RIFCSPHIGHO2_01_FULL_69_31 TaxID=1801944 RepID=UPI0008B53061|nr:hypothetical protein [Phenylobacterium sp. RIFCSPHIGHO2_01_FULL_69_31]OHB29482.1 MAG: hypothetical protein A2790_06045 [Phenylobacterium sp. RIFCSPHIGHO2_01_FULL_69_31]
MTQDDFDDRPLEIPDPSATEARRSGASGRVMAAGVVGALTLGGGLGLWARPAPPPQTLAAAPAIAPEDAPRPALQIIVEDVPAPIGPLLEVLPGDAAPQLAAPRRPSAGLMKVDTMVAAEPLLVPAVKVEPKPEPKVETVGPPKAPKVEKPRVEKPRIEHAEAEAKPKATARKIAEAKAERTEKADRKAKAARLAKLDKAKAEKVRAEKLKVEKARAEAARAEKRAMAQKAEKAKAAKLAKAEKATKLAKAEAAARAKKAEAARTKVLAKAKAKPKTQLAQAKSPKKPAVEKASTRAKPAAKAPPPRKPVVRGEGPMRVARNDACASADPGEAAVCADRSLSARDRQLQRAYRNAEAAGVPASALRRQQDRWLQARAAAAREAPWAVEDVYVARISELNDLTRDAREN